MVEWRISGRSLIALALWLLLVPVQWVAAAMLAALVHELGHWAAVWACGGRVCAVHIDLFGAKMETTPLPEAEALCCALAGPAAGGLLLLGWRWFPRVSLCALIQTAYNLLPIYPLDGGRALKLAKELFK